jgi:hypothetical protein
MQPPSTRACLPCPNILLLLLLLLLLLAPLRLLHVYQ